MLAMDVNDNAGCLNERVVQTLFAGKPAPTGNRVRFCFSPLIRPSVSSPSAFDLEVHAPSRGRVEVLRSGQPGMDAGLAAPGQGWPMAAGPRSRTGARVCRALASHRTKGARALGYLGLFQVTRRKGETNSRPHRRTGYSPNPNPNPPPKPKPYTNLSSTPCMLYPPETPTRLHLESRTFFSGQWSLNVNTPQALCFRTIEW